MNRKLSFVSSSLLTVFATLCWGALSEARPARKPKLIIPKVSLTYWNQSSVQSGNNCYNYATNRRTDSFAQPGEASGKLYAELSCESVLVAAGADLGLVRTSAFKLGKRGESLIALVVDPGGDFHWYRRDSNGFWSHKPGSTEATTLDNSSKRIRSPETADRGRYSEFCGYFRVRNFAYAKHQQNGGFVRIGSMSSLPSLPGKKTLDLTTPPQQSEVELLVYSGRRNPRLPLREVLADEKLGSTLREWATANGGLADLIELPSRLGDNGIVIHDREGILGEKGSVLKLRPAPEQPQYQGGHQENPAFYSHGDSAKLARELKAFVLNRQ